MKYSNGLCIIYISAGNKVYSAGLLFFPTFFKLTNLYQNEMKHFYLVLKPSFEHFSLLLTIGSPIRQENPGIDMHVETPLVPSTFVDALNLKKKLI